MRPLRLRPRAEQDLIDTYRHYSSSGGTPLADRMFDAALLALETVRRTPGIGSLRLGQECGIEGLRSWGLAGFPIRWFYLDEPSGIDVLRLLGERQDLKALWAVDGG